MADAAPTCPTCGGPVRIVSLANGDLGRTALAPHRAGRFRCSFCGKAHPSRRSRGQHMRFCRAKLAKTGRPGGVEEA